MKKSLLGIALGVCASTALAQGSLTVYGVADAGLVAESGGAAGSIKKVVGGVAGGSRIGFRGAEDLGGGLKALFTLEAGISLDSGASAQGGVLFGRQALVGLQGLAGTVTLGRQYTPLFLALSSVDPFHAFSMAGSAANLMSNAGIRMNNSVKFASAPSPSGFNGEVAYGVGEVAGNSRAGRQIGANAGYTKGPVNFKLGYANVNNIPGGLIPQTSGKTTLLGGSYDFGMLKAALGYAVNKGTVNVNTTVNPDANADSRDVIVGVTVPAGQGSFRASYIDKQDKKATNRDARQWGLAYNHALSKRTDAYVAFARIRNNAAAGTPGFYTVGNATEVGSGNKAFNLGMRHTF